MNSIFLNLADLTKLVQSGKTLLLAGDEEILKKVPRGNWIGGTIPYFISSDGGVVARDKVFVTELPDYIQNFEVHTYDEQKVENIYAEAPEHGFSFAIFPATSPVHLSFAINAPNFKNFGLRPLVGWVSGVHLSDIGKITPKTFNGLTGEISDKKAIVLRAILPSDRAVDIGIVNIFSQGEGDTLVFKENGFLAKDVLVNGERMNFAEYLLERKSDIKLPLVADYCGANVNVSFQGIDEKNKTVNFYAPVFKDVQYKQAKPVSDYVKEFISSLPNDASKIFFSCNCILNFLYSELEGKTTGGIVGPVTFGEIAYQLLNQTMVYMTIEKIG